jgi:hypothetical protein
MSAVLRLKLKVTAVHRHADETGATAAEHVTLGAVVNDAGANKDWTNSTPVAHMQFTVNNPAAFGKLLPKQVYFVDLTAAPAEVAPPVTP